LVLVSGAQAALLCGGANSGTQVSSTVCAYTDNPTGNSVDFAGSSLDPGGVFSNLPGATLNTGVDFNSLGLNTPSTGSFMASSNPGFYSALVGYNGLTISATGIFNYYGVQDSTTGPSDNGNVSPASPGEGPNPGKPNQYLGPNTAYTFGAQSPSGSVTFSFTNGVSAFGLFIIDLNNQSGVNPDTLSFYSGANGSGTLIATLTPVQDNFGSSPTSACPTCNVNDLYFMGLLSTSTPIMSAVFTTVNKNNNYLDYVALDRVEFTGAVPEPGSLALVFGGGLALLALRFRRRSR
jgi:hypothetical protein